MKFLRRLKKEDAPLMLEWMHDPEVTKNFRVDFSSKTVEQAEEFINNSFTETSQHFAIIDRNDEYMGTVSLKRINYEDENAEYSIVVRKCAQGSGLAKKATEEIINYAFSKLELHRIYLNVLEDNVRARKLYEKCGFEYEGRSKDHLKIKGEFYTWIWYAILNKE